jgi:PII-like signaling protein
MFFSYRKSPLGISVREYMASIIGFYRSREEAEKDIEILRDRLPADLKVIDTEDIEGWEKIAKLDPDIADIVKENRYRYVLVALWTSIEP